jgi:hypothetical protein
MMDGAVEALFDLSDNTLAPKAAQTIGASSLPPSPEVKVQTSA